VHLADRVVGRDLFPRYAGQVEQHRDRQARPVLARLAVHHDRPIGRRVRDRGEDPADVGRVARKTVAVDIDQPRLRIRITQPLGLRVDPRDPLVRRCALERMWLLDLPVGPQIENESRVERLESGQVRGVEGIAADDGPRPGLDAVPRRKSANVTRIRAPHT
jgi:hypothetical protein